MQLLFPNGHPFVTGATYYEYLPATPGEMTNRLILQVKVGQNLIKAVVDTGAPYVILPPIIAHQVGLEPDLALARERMLIRGMRLNGFIDRIDITLIALFGEDLVVSATVFVPDSQELWGDFPAFIGLGGFLERIRFAVDPVTDMFYFGSLS